MVVSPAPIYFFYLFRCFWYKCTYTHMWKLMVNVRCLLLSLFNLFFFKINFMCMSAVPACMYMQHKNTWCPMSEEGVRAPETKLQMVVSCHVGVKNWTRALGKSSTESLFQQLSTLLKHCNLGITGLASLAGQQALGILLSLLSHSWHYRHTLVSMWVLKRQTQASLSC